MIKINGKEKEKYLKNSAKIPLADCLTVTELERGDWLDFFTPRFLKKSKNNGKSGGEGLVFFARLYIVSFFFCIWIRASPKTKKWIKNSY